MERTTILLLEGQVLERLQKLESQPNNVNKKDQQKLEKVNMKENQTRTWTTLRSTFAHFTRQPLVLVFSLQLGNQPTTY